MKLHFAVALTLAALLPAPAALAQAEPAPPAPAEPPAAPKVKAAPGQGITVESADGKASAQVRSRIQLRDTLTFGKDRDLTNETQVRTLRVYFQGHVLDPNLRYTIQLAFGGRDFETGSSSPIFDAFVEYNRFRDLQIRIGQFFVPFDRARTIREFALQLVDRQIVVQELTLDRDVGIRLGSQDLFGLGGLLSYDLGLFGGDGRNRFGATDFGLLYTARLAVRPFGQFDDDREGDLQRLRKPRLMVGVAGAYNQNTDRARSTTGATYQLGTTNYTNAAADLVFKYSGFSLLAEVLYRKGADGARTGSVGGRDVTEFDRNGWGWLVQGGYMLTDRLEIAGRYDELRALGATDPELVKTAQTAGREIVAGLNYYLNEHLFKVQADYVLIFERPWNGREQRVRLQFDASF